MYKTHCYSLIFGKIFTIEKFPKIESIVLYTVFVDLSTIFFEKISPTAL